MPGDTLRIRCPTWDHLENFYERKIKDGNVLLARVPFSPALNSDITIALELPDGVVVDIAAEVAGVRLAPDGRKSAIRMVLHGMEEGLTERLKQAVVRGRRGTERRRPLSEAPPNLPRTQTGLPVPIPSDVPIDELVPVVELPALEEVPEAHRERYRALNQDLRSLREKAAHEVLGVAWDAEVPEIRLAYFKLVKSYHPDVVAKHESPAINLLASEIFIYVNKAYDRLRDSAVAAGKAIIAGPALLPHNGWLADFDDIGTVKPRRPLRSDDMSGPTTLGAPDESAEISVHFSRPPAIASVESAGSEEREHSAPAASDSAKGFDEGDLFVDARGTERGMKPLAHDEHSPGAERDLGASVSDLIAEGDALLQAQDYEAARNRFAAVLELEPRSRVARALYHVAYGHTLLERQKRAEAMTQFEVALKHDPDCHYAKSAKASLGGIGRQGRPSLFKRLFRR